MHRSITKHLAMSLSCVFSTPSFIMDNLPQGVIIEILLRLPIKSLLRFRCVSKSWLSLISSPYFANLHFQRSSQHNLRILYTETLDTMYSEAHSIDFNTSLLDDSASVRLHFPFSTHPYHIEIMGSCRGFMLLLLDWEPKLVIWNPSTRVCKQIPRSPVRFNIVYLYGFGYDALTDDYLVVLAHYECSASVVCGTNIEIFSVRTNSWKKIGGTYPYETPLDDPIASILNGAIHWLVLHLEGPQVSREVILAFDLAEKNLREVPTPEDFNNECCDLRVVEGCLSLTDRRRQDQIEIWMMREYGVKSSWSKHITLRLGQVYTKYITPICFTKDGEVVAVHGHDTGLIKCSEKGEVIESRPQNPRVFEEDAGVYTQTLFSLPCE